MKAAFAFALPSLYLRYDFAFYVKFQVNFYF